jgi:RNA polymerase sigma-70 factor (ECF subfamily)
MDRAAWVLAQVDRYERQLTRYAKRLTGDWESARDVVQHAFLQLCDQRPEAIGNVAAWLYTVCHHRAIDFRRQAVRVVSYEPGAFDGADSNSAGDRCCGTHGRELDPQESVEQRDSGVWLAQLIELLPEKQRQVVQLWAEGFSYREIAAIVGHREPYIRVLMHRGLAQLRADPEVKLWLDRQASTGAAFQLNPDLP